MKCQQYWTCPNCNKTVNYQEQMDEVFDGIDKEASFDPKCGLFLHTITCECGARWYVSISEID